MHHDYSSVHGSKNPPNPPTSDNSLAVPDGGGDEERAFGSAGGQTQLRDDGKGVPEESPAGEDRGGPEVVRGGGTTVWSS